MLVALSVQAAGELLPVDLRCDGQTGLAVVRQGPELSWRVESASRGQSPSAWQIIVASNPRTLAEDQGDLWDSGKLAASRSPFVRYEGKLLAAGQRYLVEEVDGPSDKFDAALVGDEFFMVKK